MHDYEERGSEKIVSCMTGAGLANHFILEFIESLGYMLQQEDMSLNTDTYLAYAVCAIVEPVNCSSSV